jgi:hypothetical protein
MSKPFWIPYLIPFNPLKHRSIYPISVPSEVRVVNPHRQQLNISVQTLPYLVASPIQQP